MQVSYDSDIEILHSYAKNLMEGKNPRLKVDVSKSGHKSLNYAVRFSLFSEDKAGVIEKMLDICFQHFINPQS